MKKQMFILVVLLTLAKLSFAQGVLNNFDTDPRAKKVVYHPNQIYSLKTQYLISTDIIFSDDEELRPEDVHLGDASSWDVQTNRNHLYVKAKKLNAAGNLNITTNKHSYHFALTVADKDDIDSEQLYFLKFIYPYDAIKKDKLRLENIRLPADLCQNPSKYNLQYSFTGNKEQAPIQACDDGTFTYFKFRRAVDLPAVFMVLPDRRETIVNYRMEQGYLVVERIAKAFTLRSGNTVTSVYNDRYINAWKSKICGRV